MLHLDFHSLSVYVNFSHPPTYGELDNPLVGGAKLHFIDANGSRKICCRGATRPPGSGSRRLMQQVNYSTLWEPKETYKGHWNRGQANQKDFWGSRERWINSFGNKFQISIARNDLKYLQEQATEIQEWVDIFLWYHWTDSAEEFKVLECLQVEKAARQLRITFSVRLSDGYIPWVK